jgi:hypothetical protein
MNAIWPIRTKPEIVPCRLDIEQSAMNLYAHVTLEGVEVGPGDVVLVHDAPRALGFGTALRCRRQATVTRAGRLGCAWTRLTAWFELASLCEVGFQPRRRP